MVHCFGDTSTLTPIVATNLMDEPRDLKNAPAYSIIRYTSQLNCWTFTCGPLAQEFQSIEIPQLSDILFFVLFRFRR